MINSQIIAKEKRITNYNLNPNKCTNCAKDLDYNKRHCKFCNHSCSASFTNRAKIKHGRHAEKPCLVCKKITTNEKYCSESCMGKSMIKYHNNEDRLNAKRMLGREAYARYASRKKFQTPIDEDLNAIKKFYLNCPKGHEVDHIIPISKGGPHSLSNLQYLTSTENKRKSAKLNWCPEGDSNA